MSLTVTSNTSSTGYDDIDKLNNAQNELYNKAYEQQQNIVNTQTKQNIDEINRNKDKLNEETTKQNKALYTDYTKQVNPYGATAESLATNGLGNSGVAESTKTNLYNTYQKNRTDTLNTAKSLLADYNAQITQARQNGDIQLAQASLDLYNQQIDNLYNTYQLVQNQKQFDYQKERDTVSDNQWQQEFNYNKAIDDRNYNYQLNRDNISDNQWQQQFNYNKSVDDRNYNYQLNRDNVSDSQWQQEFDYNKNIDDRNYNYQVSRDKISDNQWQQQFDTSNNQWQQEFNYNRAIDDRNYNYQLNRDAVEDNQWQQSFDTSNSQWEKEYELQKKNLANSSSRSSSRSSSSKSSSGSSRSSDNSSEGGLVVKGDDTKDEPSVTPEQIMSSVQYIQGAGVTNPIQDGISGKRFATIDELLNYYGYASVE